MTEPRRLSERMREKALMVDVRLRPVWLHYCDEVMGLEKLNCKLDYAVVSLVGCDALAELDTVNAHPDLDTWAEHWISHWLKVKEEQV